MARYAQRPENALKRANEFIDVGKPARALDTLQEVFRNKKWAYNWSESVLEPIMFKYLDLCVELKKSHIAKEGLFQYRNMFQLVNVGSLENVIRGYLRMAEERTEAAQQQCTQAVVVIDDLDNLATPESILMSAVCGEDAQDRSERTILMPWVKFLWESYCQCLELLRTNAHVETLYHDIARMVFQFCLKYNRKTEFRKLCDKLRKHLEDICKLSVQTTNVSINKPETQHLNLETRLYQLDSAIQMELWQEAYKAIEDIHGLMNISKKQPLPKTMANYYQKLSMVFWKAGNQLFHAASLLKLFQLSREMKKNITSEELQRMACRVLLSTLAIPLPSAHPEFDRFIETDKSPLEKAQRLAVLLGLSQPPTRETLLRDIVRMNVVQLASPQLQQLYAWLEIEFDPLNLCSRVLTVIETLNTDESNSVLQQYIPALQDVTLVRLVRQISQVYQSIEFARLIQLARFTTDFHLERLLVDCVRHNDMQIRIDHAKRSIHFGMDLSESQREDKPEGPTLQSMPSEQVRNQLISMATVLHQAIAAINPHRKKAERDKLRAQMVHNYHENKVKEHQRVLQRHKIIEDRKEYIERLNTVREEEELRRQEEILRQQQLAEQRRLEQEREERERKRQANERQQIKDRNLKEKMQKISLTTHGQRVLKKLDEEEMKKMDAEQIAAREAEELIKERREFQAKLKSQEKKIDYFERAKRIEEIPLIQKSLEEKQVQDRKFWEEQEANRIAQAVAERALAVAQQKRLQGMIDEKNAFLEILKASRRHVHEEKLKEFNVILDEERNKRLAQRVLQRKEERRREWLRQKAEEARRAEEALRKAQEEEKRIEKEKKLQADREHQEMLERAAAKARAREEEIERKLAADRESIRDNENRDKEKERGPSSWRRGDARPERDSRIERDIRTERETRPERDTRAERDIRVERDGRSERRVENEWRGGQSTPSIDKSVSEVSSARSLSSDVTSESSVAPTPAQDNVPRKEEVWRPRNLPDRKEPVAEGIWRRGGDDRDRAGDRDIGRRDNDRENRDSSRFERREDRYQPRNRDERERRGPEEGGRFERDSERRFERRDDRMKRDHDRDRETGSGGGGRDWRMDRENERGAINKNEEDARPMRRIPDRDRLGPSLRNERDRPLARTDGGDWRSSTKSQDVPKRTDGPPPRSNTRIEKAHDNTQSSDGDEWQAVKRR